MINEGGILLTDGSGFHVNNHFRLNLGCPRAYLKEFVQRFKTLFLNTSIAKL